MNITLYTKPSCVQCDATKRLLDSKGIKYDTVDLTQDSDAMNKVQSLGYRSAPVVISGETHWSGFRPDMIKEISA